MAHWRDIPSIDQMRQRPAVRALESRFGGTAVLEALRVSAEAVRASIAGGAGDRPGTGESVVAQIERLAAARLGEQFRPSLRPAINAAGVIVHTNLGRAPLAETAVARVADVARGYSTLEYDVERGARGTREVHAESLLRRLTGAEAAAVVNNNAAATLLVLAAMAAGREVIVSRGELVEIGGGFRVPEVMKQSGAILREVGTTNRTRAADYAAAVGDRTALILRVHPSNFRIEGFTERPGVSALVEIGRRLNVPVAEDLGSGYLAGSAVDALRDEPAIEASVAAGVDVCCFSGDKLLGGPQCGIIVGTRAAIDPIRRHPLMRALRVDKMTLAALEATLAEYAAGRAAVSVPVRRMLAMTSDEIRTRAAAMASALSTGGRRAELLAATSAIGGGSAPGITLPTWAIALSIDGMTAGALEAKLRTLDPPVVARIEHDRVLLDLRTVFPEEDELLLRLLRSI